MGGGTEIQWVNQGGNLCRPRALTKQKDEVQLFTNAHVIPRPLKAEGDAVAVVGGRGAGLVN